MPHLRTHLPVWSANSSQLLLVLSPFSQLWLHIPPAWFAANSQVENQVMIVHPFSRVSHGVLTSIFPVFSGIDSAIWAVTRQRHGDGSKTNCNYIGGEVQIHLSQGYRQGWCCAPEVMGFTGWFEWIYPTLYDHHLDLSMIWHFMTMMTSINHGSKPQCRQMWCPGRVGAMGKWKFWAKKGGTSKAWFEMGQQS